MFVCEFCNKQLSSKSNLKTHQTKAIYCLEKQNVSLLHQLKCKYCDKQFSLKHSIDRHEAICPDKLQSELNILKIQHDKEIQSRDKEIQRLLVEINIIKTEKEHERLKMEIYSNLFNKEHEFLFEQSKKLIDKTTTNTTNTTNIKGKNITMNSLNLSSERLDSLKDTYTIQHYDKGGIGQADWVVENVLTDKGSLNYRCTDKNRRNFVYQDEKGNSVSDIHATKLKEAIIPIMDIKLRQYKKIKFAELSELEDDDSLLLDKCTSIYNENRELGLEFDKRLAEKTYGR